MGQFFSGMASGRTRCAKLTGVRAATVIAAAHNSAELYLENRRLARSDFIAV